MKESYIKQHLQVDDYLTGSLSSEDLAAFEERLLWDDALVEEVALAESLREGMKDYHADDTTDLGEYRAVQRASWWSSPTYRVAASVLLAVSLLFNVLQGFDTPPATPDTGVGDPTPQVIRLIATRSIGPREIPIDSDGLVVLTIDPIDGFEEYRLTLSPLGNAAEPVALESGLRATPTEPLAISVPGSALPPDDYSLALDGRPAAESEFQRLSEVRFRAVVRP